MSEQGFVTSGGKQCSAHRRAWADGRSEVVYVVYVPGTSQRRGYGARRTASAKVAATFVPKSDFEEQVAISNEIITEVIAEEG